MTATLTERGILAGTGCQNYDECPEWAVKELRKRWRSAATRSREEHWPIDFMTDHLVRLWQEQEGKCAVSGIPFEQFHTCYSKNPFSVSLDRVDPAGHYTKDNIRLVLTAVNIGMMDWGTDTYVRICTAVACNHERKQHYSERTQCP